MFVLTLKKGQYKYQFKQFAWLQLMTGRNGPQGLHVCADAARGSKVPVQAVCRTHLIVFFTAVPTSFFVPLIFEGLMWFLMPCAFIIVNDIMAYLAGARLAAPCCAI
jgi:phosphatidate cytidylyltransferase